MFIFRKGTCCEAIVRLKLSPSFGLRMSIPQGWVPTAADVLWQHRSWLVVGCCKFWKAWIQKQRQIWTYLDKCFGLEYPIFLAQEGSLKYWSAYNPSEEWARNVKLRWIANQANFWVSGFLFYQKGSEDLRTFFAQNWFSGRVLLHHFSLFLHRLQGTLDQAEQAGDQGGDQRNYSILDLGQTVHHWTDLTAEFFEALCFFFDNYCALSPWNKCGLLPMTELFVSKMTGWHPRQLPIWNSAGESTLRASPSILPIR